MKKGLIFILIIGCINCKKDAIPVPIKVAENVDTIGENDFLDFVWHRPSAQDQICRGCFAYDSGVVFFMQEAKPNGKDHILSLDLYTGDTLWVWNEGPYFTNHRFMLDNILYFTAGTSVYALNCITGVTRWEYVPPSQLAYLNLSVSEKGIYVSYQDRISEPTNIKTSLYELSPTGTINKVIELASQDRNGFTFNFDFVTPIEGLNGDKLLFCESRSWNYGPANQGAGEYLAINATNHTVYHDWKNLLQDIDIGGRGIIENQTMYVSSGWNKLAAIDVMKKQVLWQTTLNEDQATAALMPVTISSDFLFLSVGNRSRLNIVNKKDGNVVKTHSNLGTEWFGTKYCQHESNHWFTTTAGLFFLTADGELQKVLGNDVFLKTTIGSFTNGLDISSDGLLYTTRGNDFVCFRVKS